MVCVGNLVAGGAGKTPVVLALSAMLRKRGVTVQILTRGYGGSAPGPLRVDPRQHDFRQVGDEPLLLVDAARLGIERPGRRCHSDDLLPGRS